MDTKDIETFLERNSSVVEKGKRYYADVSYLLNRIKQLENNIPSIHIDATVSAQVSNDKASELLTRILALVNEYYQK